MVLTGASVPGPVAAIDVSFHVYMLIGDMGVSLTTVYMIVHLWMPAKQAWFKSTRQDADTLSGGSRCFAEPGAASVTLQGGGVVPPALSSDRGTANVEG